MPDEPNLVDTALANFVPRHFSGSRHAESFNSGTLFLIFPGGDMRSTFSERGAHASSDSPGPLKQAEYFLSSGEEEKARDLAVRWRMVPGQSPAAYRGWGEVCRELGMARQAEECFRMALRIDRDDTDSLFLLAELCADVGRFEEAMGILRRIVRRDPGHTLGPGNSLPKTTGLWGSRAGPKPCVPSLQPRTYEDFERYFPLRSEAKTSQGSRVSLRGANRAMPSRRSTRERAKSASNIGPGLYRLKSWFRTSSVRPPWPCIPCGRTIPSGMRWCRCTSMRRFANKTSETAAIFAHSTTR